MKRFFVKFLTIVLALCLFVLVACQAQPLTDEQLLDIYEQYVQQATTNGAEHLPFTDWLAVIQGDGEHSELEIQEITTTIFSSNNVKVWRFVITYTDGQKVTRYVDYTQSGTTPTTHVCNHVCNVCGKCKDSTCTNSVCAQKCTCSAPITHVCNHVCNVCGKCKDSTCTNSVCAQKCTCSAPVTHVCNHVCSVCGKCKDSTCTNSVCAQKCTCSTLPTGVLSVSQAVSYLQSLNLGKNAFTTQTLQVTGQVKSIGSTGNYYKNVVITDGQTDLLIFTINMGTGVSGFKVGDTIVAQGYAKNHNGTTLELATYNNTYVYCTSVTSGSGSGTGGGDSQTHTHEFASYFTYGKCTHDGCSQIGRKSADGTFQSNFKYTFTQTKGNTIKSQYTTLLQTIQQGTASFNDVYQMYSDYLDQLDYVGEQYQIASVLSSVTGLVDDYNYVDTFYTEMYSNYCTLYDSFYNSNYCNSFYYGYSDDEIASCLAMSQSGGQEYVQINNTIADIMSDYYTAIDSDNASSVYQLYSQFVDANNQLAWLTKDGSGNNVYDNYMYYAYANDYNREYTPDQVATMRTLVKQYVVPIYQQLMQEYGSLSDNLSTSGEDFYYAMYTSVFNDTSAEYFVDTQNALNYIASYFKAMSVGSNNFNDIAEDLFKVGNYFTGVEESAYTYYIDTLERAIVYFGQDDDYYYQSANTFVHEFGHYAENYLNGGLQISYDHDETQSQGNEMMFLAYLGQTLASNDGYVAYKCEQLLNMVETVLSAMAVDEFENIVYANDCSAYYTATKGESYWMDNGKIKYSLYQELYDAILATYDTENGDLAEYYSDYWTYVVFDSSAYYISYAISALPCLELYAISQRDGFASAQAIYYKLFTFAKERDFVLQGQLTDNYSYVSVLDFCGLDNPFEQDLYTTLTNSLLAD